ncbi:uncharacterized protein LOC62_03G005117 [Vanrija pseudolonga]|uniref:Uncharacterized protein n=1 Tax=Vanrija pseudolonga TaxID=143232 RepID=A0AAF0Y7R0_9TREE|nr:hypothetical protein LOC62_03G005117 [Vanrija pseudolonga]
MPIAVAKRDSHPSCDTPLVYLLSSTHLSSPRALLNLLHNAEFLTPLKDNCRPTLLQNYPVSLCPLVRPLAADTRHITHLSYAVVCHLPGSGGSPRVVAAAIVSDRIGDGEFDFLDGAGAAAAALIPPATSPRRSVFGGATEHPYASALTIKHDACRLSAALGLEVVVSNGHRHVLANSDFVGASFGVTRGGEPVGPVAGAGGGAVEERGMGLWRTLAMQTHGRLLDRARTAAHPPRTPTGVPLTALSVKTGAPLSQKRKRKQPEPLPLAARLGPLAPPPSDSPPPPPPPASPAPPPPSSHGPHAPVHVPPRAIHPLNAHVTRLSSVHETVHFLALPAFRELLVPGAKPWLRSNWPVPDLPDEPAREKPRVLSFAIVYSAPEHAGDDAAPDPTAPAVHVAAGAVVTKTLTDADFDFLDSLFLPPSAGISGEIPASPAPTVPVFTVSTASGRQAITYTDKRWRALKLVYDGIDMARALGLGVWLSNGRRSVRCAAAGASASFGTRADGTLVEDKREEEAGREVGEIVEVHRPGSGGSRRSSAAWTDGVFGLMVGDAFWAMRR